MAPSGNKENTAYGALRWALRIAVTGVRYFPRRVPLYRRDRTPDDAPPPDLEREVPGDPDTVQRAADGIGPLFHRRYWVHVTDERLDPEQLIEQILRDPNSVAPTAMARFETPAGQLARDLDVGTELTVRLPGPWDGPVRVVDRTPTSFRLATLQGHMEAGEIEFRAGYDERNFLRFEIDSWARCGDRLFDWLYERVPFAREMQLLMWAQFCQAVAARAGGVRVSNVGSATQRFD